MIDWIEPILLCYADYPMPAYLLSQRKTGNIGVVGEMTKRTDNAVHIAIFLYDKSDPHPVWLQA